MVASSVTPGSVAKRWFTAHNPTQILPLHAALVGEDAPRPDRRGHRKIGDTGAFSTQLGRLAQRAIVAHIQRGMPKGTIRKHRDRMQPVGPAILEHQIVRQRELAGFVATLGDHPEKYAVQWRRRVTDIDPVVNSHQSKRVLVVAADNFNRLGHE